ncbi:L-threonylcarbamoyladenylate synthase [Listeria costaricensis]|uniref:L-threonylcarbamoyladenylate synthase n=1 Tax=Listeria costaricensis TaxID=2026604 RepID=UPI000C0713B2|nr:L-threonylcarbamoyladenylate synthase [Listeria costaricensis]
MDTHFWKIEMGQANTEIYQQAAEFLKKGETVAFPTETVYGLGADATSEQAVQKIYQAKGRPADNPLIVHIAKKEQMHDFVTEIPQQAAQLIDAFWPGPLTIILPVRSGALARNVTAGLQTVGVRMPSHPVSLALLEAAYLPIAAPSANRSGRPSPTSAAHVAEDLTGQIAGIVDGGETGVGLESTVIDCTTEVPTILRPGGVSIEQIEQVIGQVHSAKRVLDSAEAPKAPGMKYTHYAPNAPVFIVEGSVEFWHETIRKQQEAGEKVGLLVSEGLADKLMDMDNLEIWLTTSREKSLDQVAQQLYKGLRAFDHTDCSVILAESYERTEIGEAIMNRLEKAAGSKYLREATEGR